MTVSRREVSLTTAGISVLAQGAARDVGRIAAAAGLDAASTVRSPGPPELRLHIDAKRGAFDTTGLSVVTRGAWGDRGGRAVLRSAGGSGYTQQWTVGPNHLEVSSQWAPGRRELAASLLLPARARALRGQVLLHHPALWWAAHRHGLAPLHVSAVDLGGTVVLLAGPGGVGKSTLVAGALARGATATCDNVAVSDGTTVWGLREPLRIGAGSVRGPRAAHNRVERAWPTSVPALRPDVLVVVRRGTAERAEVRELAPEEACRTLICGTLAAGELMRFWPLCATLAEATGCPPAMPDLQSVSERLAGRLPALELRLGARPGPSLAELLSPVGIHGGSTP